jgi:hypothetical protein
MNIQDIKSVDDASQYAAKLGILLTAADRDKIRALQEAELQRLKAIEPEQADKSRISQAVENFNYFYPKFLQSLIYIGELLLTLSQTVIISFGIPLVLIFLLIVEHARIVHGLELFEADAALATFAGWALVLTNLVLEFQVHHIEQKEAYTEESKVKFSLRIWARNLSYIFGKGKDWQERPLSPAHRYRQLLSLVTFTILALALTGSMKSVIEQQSGAWYQALWAIVTESSLLKMMTWLGGLLFALAAVLSAQGLSRYVAIRCSEIIARMEASQLAQTKQANPYQEQLDQIAIQVIMAKIAKQQMKETDKTEKAVKFEEEQLAAPLVQSEFSANGHQAN